jgi:hypothetical protein
MVRYHREKEKCRLHGKASFSGEHPAHDQGESGDPYKMHKHYTLLVTFNEDDILPSVKDFLVFVNWSGVPSEVCTYLL